MQEGQNQIKEKTDSIELKRNFKGEYGWEVKIYDENLNLNSDKVIDKIVEIKNKLKEKIENEESS